ncbi:hypothetical protein EX30DRAFT_174776 [Ascodesmis nigricans]|uniref:Uncharacterized protein n=1 Tax=Ascodesmis nigricans TaxID=341454 RepID=A0A4S2MRL0_9PEZI|nr:hypothetical protein EX30DRAFT_174776 [Ascodesmis nigricans]
MLRYMTAFHNLVTANRDINRHSTQKEALGMGVLFNTRILQAHWHHSSHRLCHITYNAAPTQQMSPAPHRSTTRASPPPQTTNSSHPTPTPERPLHRQIDISTTKGTM